MNKIEKARLLKFSLLALFFLSIGYFFYLVFFPFNNFSLSTLLYDTGRFSGLVAFVMLSFLIFLGDTARFWDRIIGLDKTIVFNKKFSLIILVFALIHPISFMISSSSIGSYLIPDFTILPLALGIVSFYIFIGVMIASAIYKRISYTVWQYIHIFTYLLFFFTLYHAFNWGSDSNDLIVKGIYLLFLMGIIIGIIYRTSYKIMQRSNKFTVKDIKWETKDVFTLILKQKNKLKFKAGQFCFLRLNRDKLYARHPFTISSSPNNDDLEFTIKLEGRFTKIASKLKKGDEVIIEGPFGTFTLEENNKDLVFFAGGVGITPFMSIIRNQIENKGKKNITLLYGCRTKDSLIFKKELESIDKKWFNLKCFLSHETSSKKYETGYIDKEVIKKSIVNLNNTEFYICGPEPMKESIKKSLSELNAKKSNIFIEDFFW